MFERTAAVILAAGLGTRMKSDTTKLMHSALGKPLISYPVSLCNTLGLGQCVVVVGHGRQAVQAEVLSGFPNAQFAVQAEQLGTANAVQTAESATVDSEFVLILSGDVPGLTPETVQQLAQAYKGSDSPLVLLAFEPEDPTGYGRIITNANGNATQIVEHRDANEAERAVRSCNSGIYLVQRNFLFEAVNNVSTDNAQKEFYLTDIVAMAAEKYSPGPVVTCACPNEVSGVNDRADLAQVTEYLRVRKLNSLMKSGVTILHPQSTWVDNSVNIANDVVLEPQVSIRGNSRIGKGTTISQGCVITDASIGEQALIKPYCVVSESVLGNQTTIGPFAHLRPGTELLEQSKVGNFVEIKKTTLGKGSKANHLSYLGDTQVGEGVNVGAGTITCNYDGVNKHKTVLEDGVFIGSNTALIAPVTVGKDALVAAGSTVTSDVPAGALGVARSRQSNVDDWSFKNGPGARKKQQKD